MQGLEVVDSLNKAFETIESLEFRDALSKASTPVTIVATDGPFGLAGLTCSAVCSVCDNPPTVLLCLNRQSYATGIIKKNNVLSVNWLVAGQTAISQTFAGVGSVPMEERFADGGWRTIATGAPCRMDAAVSFDCAIVSAIDVGTHSVFFAEVVAKNHREDCTPLVYHRRQYVTIRSLAD
jgi:flavin reductase (DIM6/NTAB) family NADH-FMN oxidoreductase RutF